MLIYVEYVDGILTYSTLLLVSVQTSYRSWLPWTRTNLGLTIRASPIRFEYKTCALALQNLLAQNPSVQVKLQGQATPWVIHGRFPQILTSYMAKFKAFKVSWTDLAQDHGDFVAFGLYKWVLPSGYVKHSYWKWPFIVDLPIQMVIFHSYVSLPEGTNGPTHVWWLDHPKVGRLFSR